MLLHFLLFGTSTGHGAGSINRGSAFVSTLRVTLGNSKFPDASKSICTFRQSLICIYPRASSNLKPCTNLPS